MNIIMTGLLLREALDRLCVRLNMYLVQVGGQQLTTMNNFNIMRASNLTSSSSLAVGRLGC